MTKALYRKYRSKSLTEIIGQPHITSALQNALKSGKISHAYLFTGPRGTGKTSVARILAHAINQFPYHLEDQHLDIIEIDAASHTGVDNIRDLREKAAIAPTTGKYKIYIIDEVHMLSKSAFNALLKTLEEPPAHVIFIMATTDIHKVPITITSRTQKFTFRLADPATMLAHLRSIADAENIQITDAALKIIVARGGGSFRDTISLLDQISTLTPQEITAETINQALGLPPQDLIESLLTDPATTHQTLTDLYQTNIKPESIAEELIKTILKSPQKSHLPLLDKLLEVPRSPFPEAKLLLALALSPTQPTQPLPPPPDPPTTPKPTPTTPKPQPAPPPPPPPKPDPPQPTTKIDWPDFLEKVKNTSLPIYTQIQNLPYTITSDTITIHPRNNFSKTLLEKPANKIVLTKHIPKHLTLKIELKSAVSPQISQISAIMGAVEEVTINEF